MSRHKEFMKFFHHYVCGGSDPEVKIGKPDPTIFLVCASRFPDKPNPKNVLVFEDAPNGVQASEAANMVTVFIPNALINPNSYPNVRNILKSFEDFKPEVFGLPPY